MITQYDLDRLAWMIRDNIKKDFEKKHLSKNLVNTIKVSIFEGEVKIHIPAQTYNMLLYQTKGVVVHNGKGSYANKLNETGSEFFVYNEGTRKGSFKLKPHNHIGYIDKAINDALNTWVDSLSERYTMTIEK